MRLFFIWNFMDIKVQASGDDTIAAQADCLVVGVFEAKIDPAFPVNELQGVADLIDRRAGSAIVRRINNGDFKASLGETQYLYDIHPGSGLNTSRLLLVGLGTKDKFDRHSYRKAAEAMASALKGKNFNTVSTLLTQGAARLFETELEAVRETVIALRNTEYSFDKFKSKVDDKPKMPVNIDLLVTREIYGDAIEALNTGEAISAGMAFTKDLGNTPGNVCTPTWLGEQAMTLDQGVGGTTRVGVLDRNQIEKLGMNSFLSVAQGSVQEPKLIVIQYNGAADENEAPIAFVGKGITFDTGGISIKPSSGMNEMKFDMLGAASVIGAIKAAQQIGIKKNIVGVIPSCENMPSGNAVKPGDIVTSMSGLTIENNNTDAEGRLILCDALTFTQTKLKVKPSLIIDMATLTGAICVALGDVHSGLFTHDDDLARDIETAGYGALDTVWRMPMDKEFDDMLKTNHADVANVGGRDGGSSSAACFLARFINEGTRWAHLDIAGTASTNGKNKSATGRPVPMLIQFLLNLK
jgi:leucyl aminopeptidase